MKIAIVDDEKRCINEIEELLLEYFEGNGTVINTFQDGNQLLAEDIISYDIVFLDIEMPSIDGLTLSQEIIKKNPRIYIVYVSSHTSYISDTFRNHAYQFLVKPIRREDVFCDLKRIEKSIDSRNRKIKIAFNGKETFIEVRKIIYIESVDHTLKITTLDGKQYSTVMQLSKMIEQLKSKNFMQSHKSFVVNLIYVFSIDCASICLTSGDIEIPISRKYKDEFKQEFNRFVNLARMI